MATVLEKYKIQLPAKTMTYEELLDWAGEDDYAEWVDGKVIFKGTESAAHQDLLVFLRCLLKWHTEDHDAGKVLGNPFLMRLPHSARAPDLLFIANANLFLLAEFYLDGPADLAIEIISPESALRAGGKVCGVRSRWGARILDY